MVTHALYFVNPFTFSFSSYFSLVPISKKKCPDLIRSIPYVYFSAKPINGSKRSSVQQNADYFAAAVRHSTTAFMMRVEVRVAPATASTVAVLPATIAAGTFSMAAAAMDGVS